ncbi:MAG: DNA polymerase III subunit delta [Pseudomonadota bacterium]
MKLGAAAAEAFVEKPDLGLIGCLVYGPDSGRIALARRSLVAAITEGDDLRLTQIDGAAAQKDLAEVDGALRARGFFPGRRVVVIEGGKDGLAKGLASILEDLTAEDAFLLVTAQQLAARSALRKLFESEKRAVAIALYPRAMTMADVADQMAASGGVASFSGEAEGVLMEALAGLDSGGGQQLVEKLALAFLGVDGEIDADQLRPHLPLTIDAAADALIDAVVEGRPDLIGPTLRRVSAGGVSAVQIMILTTRRYRDLVALASAGDGVEAALGRLRPPVFGPRRQHLAAAVRRWGPRLEEALRLLFLTEGQLRLGGSRPDMALVERCLLRLAMMGGQAARR